MQIAAGPQSSARGSPQIKKEGLSPRVDFFDLAGDAVHNLSLCQFGVVPHVPDCNHVCGPRAVKVLAVEGVAVAVGGDDFVHFLDFLSFFLT